MSDLQRKNAKVMLVTLGVVFGMIGLSFASVPLYRMICQVTGWGGTTQMVEANTSDKIYDREITIRFNADVAQGMPWEFKPELRSVPVKVGQDGLISFVAKNLSDIPVTGTAVYNVTPLKVAKYFYKTQCFCFGEQTLQPGQMQHMPVTFFVDPAIMQDRDMDDVKTITLSYSFFRHGTRELESAIEKYYNDHGS
ncbi:MAG: cytochrome c oxidase assembly protein [Alphaproteobacteria bacterium]|nr:cytochrome c oxidase assembly protein [Alphaproteobacteria bacterium]HRI77416.1 cytochrome c oxidase assembly protein [Alphaproteobacteria bacterium]